MVEFDGMDANEPPLRKVSFCGTTKGFSSQPAYKKRPLSNGSGMRIKE
jgi:hypothetical protein